MFGIRRERIEIAWAAGVLTLCFLLLCVWVVETTWIDGCIIRGRLASVGPDGHPAAALVDSIAQVVVGLLAALCGFLILARRAAGSLGWALLLGGGSAPVLALLDDGFVSTRDGIDGFGSGAVVLLFSGLSAAYQIVLIMVPLWLPLGRIGSWRWRTLFAANLLARACAIGLAWWPPGVSVLLPATWCLEVPTVAACVAVLSARARAAPEPARRRMAILAAIYPPTAVTMISAELLRELSFAVDLTLLPYTAGLSAVSGMIWLVALAGTVIRDRMWDIDRTARHIAVTFVLSAGLVLAAAAGVAALARTVPRADRPGAVAIAVLALLAGVVLPLAIRRMARGVDRFFYGPRALPHEAVQALAARLSQAPDPQRVPWHLCRSAVEDLGLPAAALTVVTGSGPRELARVGEPGIAAHSFGMRHQGEIVGHLTVAPRAGDRGLDERDATLLRLLADQGAPAVAGLGLQEDLEAARQRLVRAQAEERDRLRRDLHDGLGPLLAAACLRLDNAGAAPSATLAEEIEEAAAIISQAVEEVRRVARGLSPIVLAEHGLTEALAQLVDRLSAPGLRIEFERVPDPLPPQPPGVESAVYRIAAEALANIARHARAVHAAVRLSATDRALVLTITDDGVGIPDFTGSGGVGLGSMRERARELGGTLDIVTHPATGSRLRVVLPLEDRVGQPTQG
ncbi:ATP-binding protein [Actinomadura litoris]|uniref:ATP-binding protein n=1 Tax=Actinomadura litoris TaxID=2678616 RepID=UPI001FA77928|nr:ATP-binding protein [Actinomadura litoris]